MLRSSLCGRRFSSNIIKDYWQKLTAIGPKYGYFSKPPKSYLIVQENKYMEAQGLFASLRVNVTAKEKTQLCAVIRSIEYRDAYVKDLVKN